MVIMRVAATRVVKAECCRDCRLGLADSTALRPPNCNHAARARMGFFLFTIALARALSAPAGAAGESGDAAAQLGTNKKGKIHFAREKKSWAGFCFVCCCLWDPPALIWQRLRDSEVSKKLSFRKRWLVQRSACFGGGGGAARESERRVGVWTRVRGLLGRRDQEKKGLGSGDTERSTATPSGGRDFAER